MLERLETRAVGSRLLAALQMLGQHMDLGLERLDGVSRQRLGQCAADFSQVAAQRCQRLVGGELQRRYSAVDLTKLALEICEIRLPAHGVCGGVRRFAVEGALPCRNLCRPIGGAGRERLCGSGRDGGRGSGRGGSGRRGFGLRRWGILGPFLRVLLGLVRHALAFADHLIQPAVQPCQGFGNPVGRTVRRLRIVGPLMLVRRRFSMLLSHALKLARQIAEARIDRREVFAAGGLVLGQLIWCLRLTHACLRYSGTITQEPWIPWNRHTSE
ncbi:MAG: hypothetical protein J0H89_13675, partial [Rhizobiales bacterium]|nr:hypothetical protein [Hyphomicrobiales bacterium]